MLSKIAELINIVQENAELSVTKEINNEMSLREDLSLDSLNLAELTVRIEEEFGVDIFSEQMVTTVGQIIDIINNEK